MKRITRDRLLTPEEAEKYQVAALEEDQNQPEPPLLHIYGQEAHHDDVEIVGNMEALSMLVNAIVDAIIKNNGETQNVFVSDGEGYSVRVMLHNKKWDDWHKLPMPYTTDYAAEKRPDDQLLFPGQIWKYNEALMKGKNEEV